ncbi:HIRAN domain-containing protein [Rhizobium helianthi]|uniref:HIRAN domain-containing protein n=1 Tax=Rhizobium helianthi TaxID=1132695 RepID=A0ABW4LZH9_9HYPH
MQTTTVVKVAGVQHRKRDVSAFIAAVRAAERGGLIYGVRLIPEPSNRYDANAIAVMGFAGQREWQIGYLERDLAREINRDLIDKGLPVAGELYAVWVGDNGFVDISIIVLAPPGNGLKARLRRRSG